MAGSGRITAKRTSPILCPRPGSRTVGVTDAGWSSSVARWAHNPEVAGSNPAPATTAGLGLCPRPVLFCLRFPLDATQNATIRCRVGFTAQDQGGRRLGRRTIHTGDEVRVGLQREGHARVSEPLTD